MSIVTLAPSELYTTTNPDEIGYDSTADVDTTQYDVIGQKRAMQAIEFGMGMRRNNYNLYLAGSTGLGKHAVIQYILEQHAPQSETPSDWCYVDNFEEFFKPIALQLPAGMGAQFKVDMTTLMTELLVAIPATYESIEYRTAAQEIEEFGNERKENAFRDLGERANQQKITLEETSTGYNLVALNKDTPLTNEELKKRPKKEQKEIQEKIDHLKSELKELVLKLPEWQKETRKHFTELNIKFVKNTVKQFLTSLLKKYSTLPQITAYLENVREDIVLSLPYFLPSNEEPSLIEGQARTPPPELARYEVNVLVNNRGVDGAPIIYENNPTYNNLAGRIEHVSQDGALITDFTLIKPGALHRANGGYLILDVNKLLLDPFAWQGLKRILYAQEIRMESLEQMYSLVSTVTLEPESIPLDVKIVLLGDRTLYHLLKNYDPEFNELFKATADFSESFDRDADSVHQLALITSALANTEKTRPIDRKGVARIIEHCSRKTGDSEKLSLHMGHLKDLILESDYWAGKTNTETISVNEIQKAIDAHRYRANQIQTLEQEQILRGTILIDTDGVCTGQINGLSIFQLGDYLFGQPTRITATARLGNGNVLDIERETKLGGAIHTKGVMILASCLANRYARNQPLALSATLVFEQSYGEVDGDSASIAEYCALISALTDIPIRQDFAVTGSINQQGDTQAIGGVNQKIEGFFEICKARELTGEQGVIIPASNVKHLMLRHDVVDAVDKKQFHIHTVETVDDALELLLGIKVGLADKKGHYPKKTINYKVIKRLEELQKLQKRFAGKPEKVDSE
jgi:lon-related putative ATP-dependent protease